MIKDSLNRLQSKCQQSSFKKNVPSITVQDLIKKLNASWCAVSFNESRFTVWFPLSLYCGSYLTSRWRARAKYRMKTNRRLLSHTPVPSWKVRCQASPRIYRWRPTACLKTLQDETTLSLCTCDWLAQCGCSYTSLLHTRCCIYPQQYKWISAYTDPLRLPHTLTTEITSLGG